MANLLYDTSVISNSELASAPSGTVKGNIAGFNTFAVDLPISTVMDFIGSTIGSILYRDATLGWTILPPGASAYCLTTNGPGTAPSWNTQSLTTMAPQAAGTFVANNQSILAAPTAVTSAQAAAMLPAFVPDVGSGGVKGLVPAPGGGDGFSGKFLGADGNWKIPALAVSQVAIAIIFG